MNNNTEFYLFRCKKSYLPMPAQLCSQHAVLHIFTFVFLPRNIWHINPLPRRSAGIRLTFSSVSSNLMRDETSHCCFIAMFRNPVTFYVRLRYGQFRSEISVWPLARVTSAEAVSLLLRSFAMICMVLRNQLQKLQLRSHGE